MTKDELQQYPRKSALELVTDVPDRFQRGGRGYENHVVLAVESALNLEWWRGWHAAKTDNGPLTSAIGTKP